MLTPYNYSTAALQLVVGGVCICSYNLLLLTYIFSLRVGSIYACRWWYWL